MAGRAPEKEVDYFAILSTVLNYSLRMLGFLDNLEDLTVLGSAVSALAEKFQTDEESLEDGSGCRRIFC